MKQPNSVSLFFITLLIAALYAGCTKDSSITDNGNASSSAGPQFKVAPPEIPVPENLAVSVAGHSVTISWDAVSQAETYQIVFDDSSETSGLKVKEATVTIPFFVNGTHNVKVRVWKYAPSTNNGGAWANKVFFTVDGGTVTDATPPVLTFVTYPQAPNEKGWFNTDVKVEFSANDPESGIASCTPAIILSNEGRDLSFTGQATNTAGLTSTVTGMVNIDKTAPAVTLSASGTKAIGGLEYVIMGGSVDLSASAADALSGVDNAGITMNSVGQSAMAFRWTPSATGEYTFGAYAVDNASNRGASNPRTIIAAYQFGEWRPPVSLAGKRTYKSGSTLPVKFTVVDANGKPVTSGLNVRVTAGEVSAMAEPDGEGIGQWKAEIKLAGSGTEMVTLSGNITPASVPITVR